MKNIELSMKNLLKLFVVVALLCGGIGCQPTEQDPQTEPQLEITTNNISGSWMLSEWNNAPLAEGMFVYLDLVRSDMTYTMYQNIDSFGTRTITGRFYLYVDDEIGASVLRGNYDHGAGEWNHRYIVESLTATTMTLVAKDNAEDVSVYTRADIPADIAE